MNNEKSIYACYEEIKQREISELKEKLKAFGGVAHFGPEYTGEGATGVDTPIVLCNLKYGGPADVRILSVGLDNDDVLTIMGEPYSENGGAGWWEDEQEIPLCDIAYGHIDFITTAIPKKEGEKPLPFFNDISGKMSDGSWVSIDTVCHSWEWQADADDDDTYISGNYEIDDVCNDCVVGYDGCYELPDGVKAALKAIGYTLDL